MTRRDYCIECEEMVGDEDPTCSGCWRAICFYCMDPDDLKRLKAYIPNYDTDEDEDKDKDEDKGSSICSGDSLSPNEGFILHCIRCSNKNYRKKEIKRFEKENDELKKENTDLKQEMKELKKDMDFLIEKNNETLYLPEKI